MKTFKILVPMKALQEFYIPLSDLTSAVKTDAYIVTPATLTDFENIELYLIPGDTQEWFLPLASALRVQEIDS